MNYVRKQVPSYRHLFPSIKTFYKDMMQTYNKYSPEEIINELSSELDIILNNHTAYGKSFSGASSLEFSNADNTERKKLAKKYKAEPYVISADVYHGKFGGRGGWSWYTGAASWYYKIMLEEVYGIRLLADKLLLSVKPLIPYEMEMTLGDTKLFITASSETKEPRLNGEKIKFPIKLPDGEIRLEVPCE